MNKPTNNNRRKLLGVLGFAGVAAAPTQWVTPVINAVLLPAHAQTSICVTDINAGGPLIGHPSGAANCQDACEAEATDQSAQLCAVTESLDGFGATQCGCDLDLP